MMRFNRHVHVTVALGSVARRMVELSALLLLASCAANIEMVKLRDAPPGSGQGTVEFFTSEEQVKRPYDELAIISVDDQGYEISDEKLTEELRKKAESINADAVIISGQERRSSYDTTIGSGTAIGSSVVGSGTTYHGEKKFLKGVAIAYKK